jgi:hypothetical protein
VRLTAIGAGNDRDVTQGASPLFPLCVGLYSVTLTLVLTLKFKTLKEDGKKMGKEEETNIRNL